MSKINKLHPAIPDLLSDHRRGKMSRRQFLRYATLLGASAVTANLLTGCNLPAAMPAPATPLPLKRGGVMRIGSNVGEVDHPARMAWVHTANQLRQVAEYLTETDANNITRPWLLERWETDDDVKTWTLYLRQGITFNNGKLLTADDVIFNFEQWLDPDIGSSMTSLLTYLNRNNIERVDDYTIRLHLSESQIGLPEHLFHYPAMILPHTFEGDFIAQPVGTGPFTLTEYTIGERAILTRRPNYWRHGTDGKSLPYLDQLIYLDLEPNDRVAAMQGGAIDTLYLPGPADWEALQYVPDLNIHAVSTAQCIALRMRVDQAPWTDNRVRQALKLCQDREKILALSYYNQGDLGVDAHVAPIHPAYCEQAIPEYNPEQARALLAEAGYPNGLKVELTLKNDQGEPEIGRVLQKLAAPAGFDIQLNIIEPSRYWSQWTEVGLGLTPWAHRPLDTFVLSLAYTTDEQGEPVAWNETRWVDHEFNTLLKRAEQTLSVDRRRKIMCQLQAIMQSRGPVGISYWRNQWTIIRAEFQNVKAHPTSYDLFYDVWKHA